MENILSDIWGLIYGANYREVYGHNVTWTVLKDKLNVQLAVFYVILKLQSYNF